MTSAAPIDFENHDGHIWLDGRMIPWPQARLHALSHSLHFASAVFEGIRVYGGKIFLLAEHTERLFTSANIVGMTIPFSPSDINAACRQIVADQSLTEAYIRPIVWRGTGSMAPSCRNVPVHVAVAAWAWPTYYSGEAKAKGIRLTLGTWRRPPPDTAPTQAKASGLYMICSLAKTAAEDQGFDDALLLDWRGYVSETTSSNIFFVIGDTLVTPKPDCFLDGLTRQTMIRLAQDAGIKVQETHMTLETAKTASEAFVTGTAAEITPVACIDDATFTPGPITTRMTQAFERIIAGL